MPRPVEFALCAPHSVTHFESKYTPDIQCQTRSLRSNKQEKELRSEYDLYPSRNYHVQHWHYNSPISKKSRCADFVLKNYEEHNLVQEFGTAFNIERLL